MIAQPFVAVSYLPNGVYLGLKYVIKDEIHAWLSRRRPFHGKQMAYINLLSCSILENLLSCDWHHFLQPSISM